jgi:4-amino-4-deoxy-L-arabinose transferase-like glycosyltransferase
VRILSWIESQGERRWLLSLAIVAVVLRLAWAGLMAEREPLLDEAAYIGHAVPLAQGEGYVNEAKSKEAFWPVGYPLCLAVVYRLTGIGLASGVGLQIGIETLTCLLLYILGKRTFGTLIARVAALLLAIYPNHVFFSTLHLTEPLFTLLLIGAFALLLRSLNIGSWGYIAAGMLLGLAALTRPIILLFPLLLPFWYVSQGWRWRHALGISLVVFCSTLVTASPWIIRNHQISGRWSDITTSGGFNFWIGNNPLALGGYRAPKNIRATLWDGTIWDGTTYERGYQLGWQAIRDAPWSAVLRGFRKISYFFALETDGVVWNLKGFERAPPLFWTLVLLLLANAAYVVMLGTGLLGLLSPPHPSSMTTLFMLLSLYMVMLTIAFFGDPRYHFPLVPFMLLFSSKGLLCDGQRLLTVLRQGKFLGERRIFMWTTAMSLLVLTMAGNIWLKYLESQRY